MLNYSRSWRNTTMNGPCLNCSSIFLLWNALSFFVLLTVFGYDDLENGNPLWVLLLRHVSLIDVNDKWWKTVKEEIGANQSNGWPGTELETPTSEDVMKWIKDGRHSWKYRRPSFFSRTNRCRTTSWAWLSSRRWRTRRDASSNSRPTTRCRRGACPTPIAASATPTTFAKCRPPSPGIGDRPFPPSDSGSHHVFAKKKNKQTNDWSHIRHQPNSSLVSSQSIATANVIITYTVYPSFSSKHLICVAYRWRNGGIMRWHPVKLKWIK